MSGHFETVRYEGGPLEGDTNDQDYTRDDLRNGKVFDYPTRGTGRGGVGAADTVERYVLERRAYGWVFVHAGTFEQPVEDQAFEAVVVGGPSNGEVIYLLGTARRWVGQRVDHVVRGCVLQHDGNDPTAGWELRFQAAPVPPCCDMHNRHCEPPGDLCCGRCTEAAHDTFPIQHADGTACVMDRDARGLS